MAEFLPAVEFLLGHEDGYANDPNDPGGETNYGLSHRTYPTLNLKDLTRDDAIAIYRRDWWEGRAYTQIRDQAVANKLFDMAVNMGAWTAVCFCQRALNYILKGTPVVVDGVFGPATLKTINAVDPDLLVLALRAYACYAYILLVEGPDLRYDTFSKTWLRRAMD